MPSLYGKLIVPLPEGRKTPEKYPGQSKWAELLKRSFAIDILKCSHCAGKMKVIATIQEQAIVRRILEAVGLPFEPPRRASPRAPPQWEFQEGPVEDISQLTPDYDSFE